jgi:hypothetical protein
VVDSGDRAEAEARRSRGFESSDDRRFLVVATLLGMVAAGAACWLVDHLIHAGVYGPLPDSLYVTPYWQDAVATLAGRAPYRDFSLEYPPLSLPVFVLPALPPIGGQAYLEYAAGFELLMTACFVAVIPIIAATVSRLGGRRAELVLGLGVVASSPLLLGSLSLTRYDIWPALLTAGATLAAVSRRHRLAFGILALAVLAKIYPAVLIPIFIAWTWRSAGRREALVAMAVGAIVGLAGLLPFVLIDPPAALDPFARALARPLQVESLGASILAGAHDWLGTAMDRVTYDFGSFNLEGPAASTASTIQTIALVALLAATWLAATREWDDSEPAGPQPADAQPADPRRFALACAAALALDVALGKVLSPQYVIWLIPALAVIAAIAGARPVAGLAVVLVLTQLYYPGMYKRFVGPFEPAATLAVLERNVALLAIALSLAWTTWRLAVPRARRLDPRSDPAPGDA